MAPLPMVRHSLIGLATVAAAVALIHVGSRAERLPPSIDADSPRLVLSYQAFRVGLHVVDSELDVDLRAASYALTTKIETIGIARWFVPWRSTSFTQGAITGAGLEPRRHRLEGEWQGSPRRVAIDYARGHVEARVEPTQAAEMREQVPPQLQRETVDPASAVLDLLRRVSAGEACEGTYAVFDGRRRSDLIVRDRGWTSAAEPQSHAFSGETRECEFVIKPISGYAKVDNPDDKNWRRLRNGRAWIGRVVPGAPLAPVRIEIDSGWGTTIVTLKQVALRTAEASRDAPTTPTP